MLVFVGRKRLECPLGETLQRAREKTNNKLQRTYGVVSKRIHFWDNHKNFSCYWRFKMKSSSQGVSDFSCAFFLYRTVFIRNERELVTWQQMIKNREKATVLKNLRPFETTIYFQMSIPRSRMSIHGIVIEVFLIKRKPAIFRIETHQLPWVGFVSTNHKQSQCYLSFRSVNLSTPSPDEGQQYAVNRLETKRAWR